MPNQPALEDVVIEIINQDGWTRGVRQDNDGRRCIAGLISYATTGYVWGWAPHYQQEGEAQALWDRIRNIVSVSPMYWNDSGVRDADEVIEVVDHARPT